jgi:Xaa-Pro aminopeptidase
MDRAFHTQNREKWAAHMQDNSVLVLLAGAAPHRSADAYHHFTANRNFYYMTGLGGEGQALMMLKRAGKVETRVYIDPVNERYQKWIGRQITPAQATEISGVETVKDNTALTGDLHNALTNGRDALYLDLFRYAEADALSAEQTLAGTIRDKYPAIQICDAGPFICALRRVKQPCEIEAMRKAIAITDDGINAMMRHSRPGMWEYEFQAHFDYALRSQGVMGPAFGTILASGDSACILHYGENNRQTQDGQLMLIDLGAAVSGYAADISRTFPVSGKYTPRQAELYNIVLEGNRRCIAAAKPGATQAGINDMLKAYYAEALRAIGLITSDADVAKYYYHGVSHSLGLDTHDVGDRLAPFVPGMVVTIEPGR